MRKLDNKVSFLKGIAIISVVMGHVWRGSIPIVYMYHLPVFFFVSGWLYNEEKYHNKQSLLFASRMNSTMKVYIGYTVLQIFIIHNLFVQIGVFNQYFSLKDMLNNFTLSLAFVYVEPISPANWFIPVSIVAILIFGGLCEGSRVVKTLLHIKKEIFVKSAMSIGCALIGFYCMYFSQLAWRLEIAFLMVPILLLGHLAKKNEEYLGKYLSAGFVIPYFLFGYIIYKIYKVNIDLSGDEIINPIVIYPLILGGVYCCLVLEKYLHKYMKIYSVIEYIGNYSLDIMMMHMVAAKLVDYVYLTQINSTEISKLNVIVPYIPQLAVAYIIAGVGIPILFRNMCKYIWKRIKVTVKAFCIE